MTRHLKKKRLAILTPQEDKRWVFAFCFYIEGGYNDLQADHFAWRDLGLEFPRLKRYPGCLP